MSEQTIPAQVSVDEQGRVIITNAQIAESLRAAAQASASASRLAAGNYVIQCGCNTVAGCGGGLAAR
jgi:hypothetical protein